ncbi:unnamed protein product, partial [marine sediment metagenome]
SFQKEDLGKKEKMALRKIKQNEVLPEQEDLLDENITNQAKIDPKTESELEIEEREFICVVCRDHIDGPVYICPRCKTFYCVKCATALKDENENCWSCNYQFKL